MSNTDLLKVNAYLLPELAVELVQLRPEVIVVEATQAIQAAKNATPSIPIVMATSIDPVQMRFVTSLARPGGNITGMALLTEELSGKRLQLLAGDCSWADTRGRVDKSCKPRLDAFARADASRRAIFGNSNPPIEVRTPAEFASAFSSITAARAGALIVTPDPMLQIQYDTP